MARTASRNPPNNPILHAFRHFATVVAEKHDRAGPQLRHRAAADQIAGEDQPIPKVRRDEGRCQDRCILRRLLRAADATAGNRHARRHRACAGADDPRAAVVDVDRAEGAGTFSGGPVLDVRRAGEVAVVDEQAAL